MKQMEPIFTIELMSEIDRKLIELLRTVSDEDWSRQTIAPKWNVKDVAVHLLDGNIRTLSMLRDNFPGESAKNINSYEDLVNYLNILNADWVKAMKRISPTVLIELLEITGNQYCSYLKSLNPFDKATYSVAWAGEKESENWFHIAREYTEKWHHQQQIRLVVGSDDELLTDELYFPYLDTSMRALPFHYRTIQGKNGEAIKFVIYGKSNKEWFLKWAGNEWDLLAESEEKQTCEVKIKDEIAWRLFTKGIDRNEAMAQSEIKGKQELGNRIFELIAVMA